MAEERSRKRLWEDYVFQFLQKIPQEDITTCIHQVARLADGMLEEHDNRWRSKTTLGLTKPVEKVK